MLQEREIERVGESEKRKIDIAGVMLSLVRLPTNEFAMNDQSVWISECEITNSQFRRFVPSHNSGYYTKRRDRADGKGLSLNDDDQPAVRVSYVQAKDFCRWLSKHSGLKVSLPTEQQWEYACRAGSVTAFNYGTIHDDFSSHANLADRSFSSGVMNANGKMMPEGGVTQVTGGVPHLLLEGAHLSDTRFDDGKRVTADVGCMVMRLSGPGVNMIRGKESFGEVLSLTGLSGVQAVFDWDILFGKESSM